MRIRELAVKFSLPQKELEDILIHYFGVTRSQLYLNNFTISPKLLSILQRRREGYPVEYLTNTAFFLDRKLYIDERVFIPRPETEGLVMTIYDLSRGKEVRRILDIGTGSGNIALSLACLFPTAKVLATDRSRDALKVARINIKRYHLEERVKLILADLFDSPKIKPDFDIIVSNPPYVPSDEIPLLPRSVLDFEPRGAIDGGRDGFWYIQRILTEGRKFLKEGGRIFLEIDPRHKEKITALAPGANFLPDLAGKIRYAIFPG